ncbi:MAG: acetyltransferase [Candidatus Eremiobacteraeota bacterium]|nr:acetyltransferase [Candidatus Eremiobacteraeota bacterium]
MRLALLGAGGHGKVVCRVAQRAGFEVVGFYDDFATGSVLGLPVLGRFAEAGAFEGKLFVSLGRNDFRAQLFRAERSVVLIDPSAVVDETVRIGLGTVVMAGAVVNVDSVIGENCILNTGCSVDHDCVIEDHVHLCPGTHLAGTVRVGSGVMLGTGTSVIPGRSIGAGSVVGAGAAVVRDLPAGIVATGVPARVVRDV